jgi:AmmeMemoRadiSam system protein B
MSYVREMTHAGEWYPTDASLARMMKASFYYARIPPEDKRNVVGIISPHSCYTVCLRTAATGYARIDPDNYSTVILLGTCHYRPLTECLVSDATIARTPFGDLEIDTESCRRLCADDSFDLMTKEIDETEHSLEMQYPLLKWVFGDRPIKLIPILVGVLTEEKEVSIAAVLRPLIRSDRTLFVISSDFTHWGEIFKFVRMASARKPLSQQLRLHDEKVSNVITQFNVDHFRLLIEEMQGVICGCHAICLVMDILDRRRYQAAVVDRSELCALTSPKDFSISFVAIVFKKIEGDVGEEEDDTDLMNLVDPSLFARLHGGR